MQGFPVHHQLWKLAQIHVHWVSDAIQLSHPLSSHYLILCHPILLHALLDCKEILVKLIKIESESDITQSCPTLCDPMECSLPCSSIHGIFQARVLEWIAISFSRGSSGPRDWTWVSHITGRHFTIWATREDKGTLIVLRETSCNKIVRTHRFVLNISQRMEPEGIFRQLPVL